MLNCKRRQAEQKPQSKETIIEGIIEASVTDFCLEPNAMIKYF